MQDAVESRSFFSGTNLLRFQLVMIVVAVAARVLRWIFHVPSHFIPTLLYSIIAGNTVLLLLLLGYPVFARRAPLWKWTGYILLLVVAGFIANSITEAFLYPFFTSRGTSFEQAADRDLPFALLATFIVGMILFLFDESQSKLEAQHVELQRKLQSQVQLGLSEKRAMQSDLDQAHDIQMHLLPRETPQLAGFQIACAWQPARRVSGDYFDILPLAEGKLGLCIADVSGKGMAAALLMANLQASVKALAKEDVAPSSLCAQLNSVLCDNIAPGRFVTLLYAVLYQQTRRLIYESAGHSLPLLVHRDGTIDIPKASGGVLGLFQHWTFSDHELQLEPGDVLMMVTDGVIEACDDKEEEFGYQRLIESVRASRKDGADAIRRRVLEDVTAFCSGNFADDASLIVLTVD